IIGPGIGKLDASFLFIAYVCFTYISIHRGKREEYILRGSCKRRDESSFYIFSCFFTFQFTFFKMECVLLLFLWTYYARDDIHCYCSCLYIKGENVRISCYPLF